MPGGKSPDGRDPARLAFEQAEAEREAKAAEKKSARKKVAGEATQASKTIASHTAKGAAGGGGIPGAAAGAATGTARAVLQSDGARAILKRMLIAVLVIVLLIGSVQLLLVSQTTSAALLAQQETTGSKGSQQAMEDLDMASFTSEEDGSDGGAKKVTATENLQILQDAAGDAAIPWQVLYSVLEMQHEGSDGVGPYQVEEKEVLKGQRKAIEDDFEASTVFVAEEISTAATSTSGVDPGLDIGSGTTVDENEKLSWSNEKQFEEEIYEPWSEALGEVPLEGADQDWGRDVIEAAVQLRFGKKAETEGACPTGPGRGTDEGGGGKGTKVGSVNLTGSQTKNAETIVQVGRALGFSDQGQVVALMVAFQESTLENLDHGDRDSLGLFQQRSSADWGTRKEITDPVYSATAFYLGAGTNPGLEDTKGWEGMEPTVAAQKVQRSAFPDAYAKHEPASRALLEKVHDKNPEKPTASSLGIPSKLTKDGSGGEGQSDGSGGKGAGEESSAEDCGPAKGGTSCKATGMAAEEGLTPDAKLVLRCAHAEDTFFKTFLGVGERAIADDHPAGRAVDIMIPDYDSAKSRKRAEKMADYLMENRRELGVKYLIYRQKIWNVDIDGSPKPLSKWRGMEDRGDDTLNHHDHIHVSVFGDKGTGFSSGQDGGKVPEGKWALPIKKGKYSLTSPFDPNRVHPELGIERPHRGTDFGSIPAGSTPPMYAIAGGKVTQAGDSGDGFGNLVVIKAGDYKMKYAHMSEISVKKGQTVKAGEEIGNMGTTGLSTGEHLHLEFWKDGTAVDPIPVMKKKRLEP